MVVLALALGLSIALCLLLTPLAARLACRIGLVDTPDGRRKIQPQPVPLAGGLAIFVTLCVILGTVSWWTAETALWFDDTNLSLPGLLGAGAILCIVGVVDDRIVLRGRHKLIGQVIAIAVLLASGVSVKTIDVFGLSLHLGWLAVPFTVFWMLGAINSLNLIDGMDGMVGCVGAVISLAIAALSVLSGQFATAIVALTLVGAVVGFLCFNLPPARVYLGDCGSMLIGLIIGVMSLQSGLKGPATVMLTIPLALMTIPIFDTMAAITRRTLTGRSIYMTDRGHLHHCLQRNGLSRRRALVLVSLLCLLTGVGALASMTLHRQIFAVVSAGTVAAILIVTRLFGHSELLLVKKRLAALLVRLRHGRHDGHSHGVAVHLQGSADWDELWDSFIDVAAQLQLTSICLDMNIPALHERYHAFWDRFGAPMDDGQEWRIEVPLTLRDQIIGRLEIKGQRDQTPVFEKIAILGKIAEDIEQAVTLLADTDELGTAAAAGRAAARIGLTPAATT